MVMEWYLGVGVVQKGGIISDQELVSLEHFF
jgi:hypothetical protein